MPNTIKDEFQALDGIRQGLIDRCERYAGLTLPTICAPDGYDENSDEANTDYQSVGAQALNNLANKLILALFAPSRPFFRIDIPANVKAQIAAQTNPTGGAPDSSDVDNLLAVAEKNCVTQLEQNSTRPKLYNAIKHLIVTGNCLLVLPKAASDPPRVIGIKKYVVKRSQSGRVLAVIVKECVKCNELDPKVQAFLLTVNNKYEQKASLADGEKCNVEHYTKVQWDGKNYILSQAVDEYELPADQFGGKYSDDDCPYRPLTWDLADENNYGTGLVEQCSGDLEAISLMSESVVRAAILASEFRWLVNPAGQTSVQDFLESNNGDAIPGQQGDISPLNSGATMQLQPIQAIATQYINRIGQTFLLLSSVIRNSERTTLGEVTALANELETSLGGVYSRLAVDMQKPIANWLIKSLIGKSIQGINPVIVTGLDALSRNGDLENLQQCLTDCAQVAALGPQLLARLKIQPIINAIFSARGLNPNDYVLSDAEAQAAIQQQAGMQAAVQSAPGVAQAVAKNATQPQGQQ